MKLIKSDNFSAAAAAGWIFGLLAGIGGFIHGLGAALQGSASTNELWIKTWDSGPIYEYLDGAPGITIVPNFLITGILAILASLLLIYVSIALPKKKNGGLYIVCSSVIMLLTGGGIIQPVVGILAGTCVMGFNESASGCPQNLFEQILAFIWPYLFLVKTLIIAFVAVVPLIFAGFAGSYYTKSSILTFAVPVLLMIALNFTGREYDAKSRTSRNGES